MLILAGASIMGIGIRLLICMEELRQLGAFVGRVNYTTHVYVAAHAIVIISLIIRAFSRRLVTDSSLSTRNPR